MRPAAALPVLALLALGPAAAAAEEPAGAPPTVAGLASGPDRPEPAVPPWLLAAQAALASGVDARPLLGVEGRLSLTDRRLVLGLQGDAAWRPRGPARVHGFLLAGGGFVQPLGRWSLSGEVLGGVHGLGNRDYGPGLQDALLRAAALRAELRYLAGRERARALVAVGVTLVTDLTRPPDRLGGGRLGGLTTLVTAGVGFGLSLGAPR